MKQGKDYIGVGVGAVIFNEKNEILLLLRNKSPEKGHWSIPGGKVEMFETIEEAIIREVKEETDIDIEIVRILTVTNHIISQEKEHWVAPTFLAKIIKGQAKNIEFQKHKDIGWFSIEELPDNITITTKNAIKELTIKEK
ncbi:NUDIX domain-containing protein [Clostridium botulinum]|uniref:MutT/NUDIX family protein n=1 Tax=Clostridium botulinum D str. 1873 TaxID=592027 RepID=A0A9P2G748_CLOBO|nr:MULTISPECIES: NUDIX domain-containing protein [Clostridium]EES91158.1 MutT/NUDIX family protein [Clostridium botulinum D str. 1873]MBO3441767.1 NUDIX domain-containing protein [Clostridium haemolyticum]MCD3215656.1 NUDIX domain-containing protein [Clostridium botulinum C]MCD3244801.1 NUDIX domain-containing protein [Clostridium botulinum C]MCD3261360.1 NUDIX domain-containing protein [Clostridium botulinum C]